MTGLMIQGLNETQKDFFLRTKFVLQKERRKRIDKTVQKVLRKLGKNSITSSDYETIRICYGLCRHSFTPSARDTISIRKMWLSIYNGLHNSPLFHQESSVKGTVFTLKEC